MRKRNRKVEKALRKRFPGWKGKMYIHKGDWEIVNDDKCKKDFYDLYPDLTKEEADAQIVVDWVQIIRQYMPNATLEGYGQHGKYVKCEL